MKNDDDTEADYSYTIRSLFSSLPDNVLVAERIVDESIEDGIKTTTYRATFVGPGASYAAERFKPEGEIIRQSKSASEDDNSVTITYTVKDSIDGAQRLRYHNAVAIDWALPAKTTFESDGQPPLIMDGARGVTTITEEGFSIWKGVVPPPHPPITSAGLVLTNKATKVEPESEEITGLPNTYLRTWSYTYWVTDEITEESLNVSTLLNPLEK